MIRGTTPTLIYKTDFDRSLIKELRIIVKNRGYNNYIEKYKKDVVISPEDIRFDLTQEDTLSLSLSCEIETQLQIITDTDPIKSLVSDIFTIDSSRILKEEPLSGLGPGVQEFDIDNVDTYTNASGCQLDVTNCTFDVKLGSINTLQGKRGFTFTPNISPDGTLTWSNDGELPNPDPIDLTPEFKINKEGYLEVNL